MARQRPPSLRIDVGDNSAVPARLRNILEAHPETASSSPGSLRRVAAFVTEVAAAAAASKSDTDTALREMLQLPQLRYAVGDADVVPTDVLARFRGDPSSESRSAGCARPLHRAHRPRHRRRAVQGADPRGAAAPPAARRPRRRRRLAGRQPVHAVRPRAQPVRPAAARQRRPPRGNGGQPRRSRSGSGDADGGGAVATAGCSCCAAATGSASDPLPAAGRSVSFRRRRRRRRRGRRVSPAGFLCCVEPRRAGVVVAHAPPLVLPLAHEPVVDAAPLGVAAAVELCAGQPRGRRDGRPASVHPRRPRRARELCTVVGIAPSPTAGFAAGFAAGGPPPSVDVSGNSSKEAASPRQSRSSSKEAATPKRVRLCGSYVPSGRSSASASVSSSSPDDSFKQAAAAAATSAAAASAAGAAAQPSPPRHHAREVVLPLQTAAAADLPPAEPVPAVRAASAASERYSDDEELAALGPPPGRSASQESLDAELAALGPPPTLDGRLRDSEASDFVFEDEEDATTRLAADAAAAAAGAPAVLPPSVASSERNSGGGHPERNSAVRWHSPILGGSKVSSTESLPRRSAGSPGTSPGLAAVLTVSTPPEEEELRPPMVRGRSVSMGALQPERAATSPGSSGVAGGRGSAPLPVAPPVARTRSHESSPTQTPPELRSPIFGSPSCAACDPSVWQQYGAGGGAVPASPRRCRPRRPSRASMGDEGSFTLGDSSLPRTPGAGGGSHPSLSASPPPICPPICAPSPRRPGAPPVAAAPMLLCRICEHMVDADQMDAHSRECRLDVVVFNAEQRLAKLQRAIEREISSRRSPPLRSGRPAAAAAAAAPRPPPPRRFQRNDGCRRRARSRLCLGSSLARSPLDGARRRRRGRRGSRS